jgi:arylsulfatase A-like enzyme
MWAAAIDPHRDYKQGVFTNPHNPNDVIVPPYIPDIPGVREDLADYYDEVSRFDEHIGMVLKALEEKKILDNTIIIVMTDNGRPFMQCKTRVNNQGLKSPFIVRYPPLIKPGTVTNSLASAVDLAPTLLELGGAKKAKVMQGFSLVPVLKSPDAEIRKYAFGEHNWHVFQAFERAVITKEYLYTKNWLYENSIPPVNETIAMPVYQEIYQMWKNGELKKQYTDCFISPRPTEELFDIRNDIHCMNNLSKKKNKKEMKEKLESILDVWQQSTGDVFPGKENIPQDSCDRVTGIKFIKK